MAELIVAFDLPSGREALAMAARLSGLRWAKIGPVLFGREGPPLVKEFIQRGIRVFLDLKWHDIPNIVASAVSAARELGVSMTTVHCLGGRNMLTAAAHAAGGDVALVGVTVLTSHDAAELESVLGRGVPDVGFEAERLGRLALHAGLRGVVTSGQEVGLLREALGPDPWIVVPGIRASGDPAGDQVRTIEPAEAVRRGATHLVVGRPITGAGDPVAAYRRLVEVLD
ncbi:MAG TPA: orotidine-5'-phosphate decarboxylase [Gemmatimonadales bacterium]|jgi:orotidine-5'-phosphate decarboxylase|nr:orotidine-5'-phosphate decarboxylase [Gemmatimonadales bacterium]